MSRITLYVQGENLEIGAGLVPGNYLVNELREIWAVRPRPVLVDTRCRNPTSHSAERETEVLLPTRRTCSLMVSSSVRSSPASRLIRTTFPAQR